MFCVARIECALLAGREYDGERRRCRLGHARSGADHSDADGARGASAAHRESLAVARVRRVACVSVGLRERESVRVGAREQRSHAPRGSAGLAEAEGGRTRGASGRILQFTSVIALLS